MHQLSGLHFEDCLADRFDALRWGCRRSRLLDRLGMTDLLQTSISAAPNAPVRQLGTSIRIQTTFSLDDPFKFKRFLDYCMAHRHEKHAPASVYMMLDYNGRNMRLLASAACDALRQHFGHVDPRRGFIYVLLVDSNGHYVMRTDPFVFKREFTRRYANNLVSEERRSGRVTNLNGSGFTICGDGGRLYFCYYSNVAKPRHERPEIGQRVSYLPTKRKIRRWRLATSVAFAA